MPAPQTCDIFIELCRKSGVVEDERLDAFLNQNPLPADPRLVAAYMIQAGILTRFQAVQLLHGKYRGFVLNGLKILDQLGVGGMGAVYLCEQVMLRRKVAVKVLPNKQAQDRVARERFFREARAVAALDHPNIIRIHDCVSSDDVHYLLMEYIDGVDLQVKLDRNGRLGVDEAIGYILQATSGLLHAHERGLVHRDVKPSNLLLDSQGTIKLLDMGLARFFQDAKDNLTQQLDGGAVVGTVDFLAPEQAIESSNVDARADLYSLGATLYTLLSGKPPFGGSTTQKLINHQVKTPPPLNEIRRDVPVELNAIVQKMMAKTPDERYQSAQEVMEVLAAWAPAPTIRSSTTTTFQAPRSSVLPQSVSEVHSNPKSPKSAPAVAAPPEKKPIRKELLIGGGIAFAAVLGAVVILSLGGGKDYDEPIHVGTDITVKEQPRADLGTPKPGATPKKVEPKKSLPSVARKTPPAPPIPKEGRVLVALDWKDFEPLTARFRGSDRIESRGDGKFPRDWQTSGWDKASIVETSLEKVDDQPALVQRNVEGKACNMVFTPTLRFSPFGRYEVHVEYRTRGEGRGQLVLQDDLLKHRTVGEFPPSRDEWRTQRFCFDGFTADVPGRFEFQLLTIGPEASIAYRRIQIRELPLPPRDSEKSIYKMDFSEVPAFSVRYLQMKPIPAAGGSLPEGWFANCWKAGSQCETTIEEVGSTPLLALRNLEGDPTLQFKSALPMQGIQAGKMYRLRVTYLAEAKCNAEFQIRMQVADTSNNHFPGAILRNTSGLLRTLEEDFSPLPNQNYSFYVQNLNKGEQSTLFMKSVEVLEVPPSVGESVAKLDATALQPFKSTLKEQDELYRDGAGNLPAGWKALTGKPRAIGTVGVEKIADRNALSLEVLEGDPSTQVQSSKPLGTLLAGHTYELRARYSSPANRRAAVSVCDGTYGQLMKLSLLPTESEWRTSSLRFDIRNDQPFNLVVANTGKPEEGKVYFESVELIDVTK